MTFHNGPHPFLPQFYHNRQVNTIHIMCKSHDPNSIENHIRKPARESGRGRWEYERDKIRKPQARNQTYRLREMRKGMALWQCKILWYVRGKIKGNPREEFPLISYLLIRFSAIRTAFVFHTFTKWTAWWTFANHGLTAHCAILLHINRIRGLT